MVAGDTQLVLAEREGECTLHDAPRAAHDLSEVEVNEPVGVGHVEAERLRDVGEQ